MGCCTYCGKLILIVLNLIIMIISMALLAGGLFVRFGKDVIKQYQQELLNKIKAGISSTGLGGASSFSADNFDLGSYLESFTVIMIVIGAVLLVVSFCGMCGACCEVKYLLIFYAVFVSIFLATQVTFIIILFAATDTAKGFIKSPLQSTMKDFQGLNGTNVASIAWNFIMQAFQCCGVQDYKDFSSTAWWGNNDPTNIKMPLACCKTLPQTSSLNCANHLDSNLNNFDKGCVDKMWQALMEYKGIVIGILVGLFLAQFILVVFAAVIANQSGKTKNKVHPEDRGRSSPRQGQQIIMATW
ncbi:hypothetical protein CHS0354_011628 [Potamilus streckersoni]|uniref:Tetraspanin n=1 Tax=Potamilus streckersoni TaxID=2493646 RepID=A0AAE0WGU3_9BIVA|nr:hypothetical protein CHS0354_011628 [Potamilus streckersoni]